MSATSFGRVSSNQQEADGNLADLMAELLEVADKRGVNVIEQFSETGSGWRPLDQRPDLIAALKLAKERGAFLLIPSTSRLLRHPDFHPSKNPDVLPTVGQFEELMELAAGVPIVSVLDPDMPWREVRRHEIARGLKSKGVGGRPKHTRCKPGLLKDRRNAYRARAKQLRKKGLSYREIADALNQRDDGYPCITFSAVRYWVK